jgi:hypothetical protein
MECPVQLVFVYIQKDTGKFDSPLADVGYGSHRFMKFSIDRSSMSSSSSASNRGRYEFLDGFFHDGDFFCERCMDS